MVFMLVVLKIPIVYLCAVVYWAIKAEPEAVEGDGPGGSRWRPRSQATGPRPRRGGPHGSPSRSYSRPAERLAR